VDRRQSRQGFGDRFAIDFIGEPEIGAMTRLARLMAATARLTTPARGAGNTTRTKVAELRDLLRNHFTLLF
jgi:hypothetical protein